MFGKNGGVGVEYIHYLPVDVIISRITFHFNVMTVVKLLVPIIICYWNNTMAVFCHLITSYLYLLGINQYIVSYYVLYPLHIEPKAMTY